MPDSAIKLAKDAMFSDTAVESWLTRLGGNYGVPRPQADPENDELYRKLLQLCALQPKIIKRITIQLLEVIFGKRSALIAQYGRAWACYAPKPNRLVVEVPYVLVSGNTSNATYLHGLGGRDGYTPAGVGATNTLYVSRAEDFTRAATTLVGLTIDIGGGSYVIQSVTYDGVGLNTIVLTTSPLTQGQTDLTWAIRIPASGNVPGSYLAANGQSAPSTVGNRPVVVFGPAKIDIFKQYMLDLIKMAGVTLVVEVVGGAYVHPPGNPLTH